MFTQSKWRETLLVASVFVVLSSVMSPVASAMCLESGGSWDECVTGCGWWNIACIASLPQNIKG